MDITHIHTHGLKFNVRVPVGFQDVKIISETISSDTYGVQDMAQAGFYPKVILDIGGHIGSFGVFAKSVWPQAELIAIEPNKDNCELYEANLKDNGFNGTVITAAVSYNAECRCLLNSPKTTGGFVLRTPKEASEYAARGYRWYDRIVDNSVKLITVEEITRSLDVIDLAKWDCEGAEVDVFCRMSDESAAKFRYMVGEYHIWAEKARHHKADKPDCIDFWRAVKRKFPHLNFTYKDNALGLFQAWPKEIQNVAAIGNSFRCAG